MNPKKKEIKNKTVAVSLETFEELEKIRYKYKLDKTKAIGQGIKLLIEKLQTEKNNKK